MEQSQKEQKESENLSGKYIYIYICSSQNCEDTKTLDIANVNGMFHFAIGLLPVLYQVIRGMI